MSKFSYASLNKLIRFYILTDHRQNNFAALHKELFQLSYSFHIIASTIIHFNMGFNTGVHNNSGSDNAVHLKTKHTFHTLK